MTSKHEERAIRNVLTTNFDVLSTRIAAASARKLGERMVAKLIVTRDQFQAVQDPNEQKFASQLVMLAMPLLEFEPDKFKSFLKILLEDTAACKPVGRKMCEDMVKGKS